MDECECPKCPAGLPAWLATFADLMSLLMCFFVLLLSFAEIDAIRFKKMAESMKDAFGVQREIPANEIVKGVSVIKQEWSPSITDEAVITEIKQETSDTEKEFIELNDQQMEQMQQQQEQQIEQQLKEQVAELQEQLEEEIDQGLVTVEKDGKKIIIRIQEKGSFASGSASLNKEFLPVAEKISTVIASKPGRVKVVGHTDNVPIRGYRFRSNWELSAARAVTVLHALTKNPELDQERIQIEGYGETRPLVPNDSRENRALNRRVELIIVRGEDEMADEQPQNSESSEIESSP